MIWDLSSGQSVLTLPGPTGSGNNVTFSPDGQYLATSEDRTVRVWNAATGAEVFRLPSQTAIVNRVAYSRDGSRLAAASRDGTVNIWDALTGEPRATVRGHTSAVWGLTYSPDGRRLVTAAGGANKGGDRLYSEIKLWDVLTGQEIFALHGSLAYTPRVAYDRSGQRLAATGDRQVTIWEGVSLAADLASERHAASLVKFLFTRLPTADAVSARVKSYAVSDEVRQRALAVVEPFWRDRARDEAEQKVRSLLSKGLSRSEVLAALRADPVLSEPVRQEALALAERLPGVPYWMNIASRAVASRPEAEPATYSLAVERAEISCRLMPFEGSYQTTLGMAQYRVGKYQEALTTLTLADELNRAAGEGPVPADLAFLAMSRYQMNEKDRAQASLMQLRDLSQKPNWARNQEAQRVLKEAEALLAGSALQPEN